MVGSGKNSRLGMWTWAPVSVLCSECCRVRLFVTLWTVAHQAPLSRGFLQARILEWVAYPFPKGSSWPRNQTRVSCIAGRFFTCWATMEASSVTPFLDTLRKFQILWFALRFLNWKSVISDSRIRKRSAPKEGEAASSLGS